MSQATVLTATGHLESGNISCHDHEGCQVVEGFETPSDVIAASEFSHTHTTTCASQKFEGPNSEVARESSSLASSSNCHVSHEPEGASSRDPALGRGSSGEVDQGRAPAPAFRALCGEGCGATRSETSDRPAPASDRNEHQQQDQEAPADVVPEHAGHANLGQRDNSSAAACGDDPHLPGDHSGWTGSSGIRQGSLHDLPGDCLRPAVLQLGQDHSSRRGLLSPAVTPSEVAGHSRDSAHAHHGCQDELPPAGTIACEGQGRPTGRSQEQCEPSQYELFHHADPVPVDRGRQGSQGGSGGSSSRSTTPHQEEGQRDQFQHGERAGSVIGSSLIKKYERKVRLA